MPRLSGGVGDGVCANTDAAQNNKKIKSAELFLIQTPCQIRVLEQQQAHRDEREHEHYRMNIFATANNQIKANVRNEAPEYSLGNREGQGDEDYSQKRR